MPASQLIAAHFQFVAQRHQKLRRVGAQDFVHVHLHRAVARMRTGRAESVCSHSVNRYSAAMAFFASSPGASLISISTFSAVKSSMDLMRIFFLRAASSMDAVSESVVVPQAVRG